MTTQDDAFRGERQRARKAEEFYRELARCEAVADCATDPEMALRAWTAWKVAVELLARVASHSLEDAA